MKLAAPLLFVLTIAAIALSASAQERVLSLDGDSSYAEVLTNPSLDISRELTIELWFTNDVPENDAYLIMKSGDATTTACLYGLCITNNSSRVGFRLGFKNNGNAQINRVGNFANGRWHHLAGTFDGQVMIFYIDGVKHASLPLDESDEIAINNQPLHIGTWPSRETFHSGLIDEVRLWEVARSQAEIRATMNVALTGEEEGLVGYWNFDSGEASDLSRGGNDAQLYNNAQIMEYSNTSLYDDAPPTVIKTIPSSLEDVPVDIKEIKFFFSEEMSEGWAIEYLDNLPVGAIAWDDSMKALTISIEQPLQPSSIYFVILNPTIAPRYVDLTSAPNFFSDVQGSLLEDFFFIFTTDKRGEVDIAPPTVKDVNLYKADADGVPEETFSDLSKRLPADITDIKIVFSEKMREKGNKSIRYSDNFPLRNVIWNKGEENGMTSVNIHLREPLVPKSEYYVRLNTADKKYMDLAGNLLEPYTITFTTTGTGMLVPEKECIATTWGAIRRD